MYNISVHQSIGFNPFEVMFICNAFFLIDIEIDNKSQEELWDQLSKEKDVIQTVQTITKNSLKKLQIAQNNIKKQQEKQIKCNLNSVVCCDKWRLQY